MTEKVAINTHNKTISAWIQHVTQTKKRWDNTNNTLVSLCTTWLNERQGLRSLSHRESLGIFAVDDTLTDTMTVAALKSLRHTSKQARKCMSLLQAIIHDLREYAYKLETVRDEFLSEYLECTPTSATLDNNRPFSIQPMGDALTQVIMDGEVCLLKCGDGWSGRDGFAVDHAVLQSTSTSMQRSLTTGPVPTPPMFLVTVARALEWHAEVLDMLEREMAVKRVVVPALFSANHAQHLLALEHNNSLLFHDNHPENDDLISCDDSGALASPSTSSLCSSTSPIAPAARTLAHVLDTTQLQRVRERSLLAASMPDCTSFGMQVDTGAHAGPEPEQMSMYLTALSLEAYVDGGRIKYITNACTQMLGSQLSID